MNLKIRTEEMEGEMFTSVIGRYGNKVVAYNSGNSTRVPKYIKLLMVANEQLYRENGREIETTIFD